jgi:hypothetical protein
MHEFLLFLPCLSVLLCVVVTLALASCCTVRARVLVYGCGDNWGSQCCALTAACVTQTTHSLLLIRMIYFLYRTQFCAYAVSLSPPCHYVTLHQKIRWRWPLAKYLCIGNTESTQNLGRTSSLGITTSRLTLIATPGRTGKRVGTSTKRQACS